MSRTPEIAQFIIRSALIAGLCSLAGSTIAQDAGEAPESDQKEVERIADAEGPGTVITLDLRARLNAEADFDTPVGTIESTSVGADLGFLIPVDDRGSLLLKFGADVTNYDITPPTGAVGTTAGTVGAQFDAVTEFGFDGFYTRALDAETSIFVGGGIGSAAEGGASDALVWNALGGVAFQINPKLRLGIGVGVFSQIEDDVRIVPIPQIYYAIDEYWSIQSEGPGAKLNYKWSDEMSMGVLARFEGKSFRIDSDNTLVPSGAVSTTGVPISYYLNYTGGETSRISLFGEVGVTLAGSMEILNSAGVTVVDEDIDPSVFVSGGLKIEF